MPTQSNIDLALALKFTGGVNLPADGDEGAKVRVAPTLQPGSFFEYVDDVPHAYAYATHAARTAAATSDVPLGALARVSADGTIWRMSGSPAVGWQIAGHCVVARASGSVANGGGTLVANFPLADGYSYRLRVHARADDGASSIEYVDEWDAYAQAISATATIEASARGLNNSASGWATAVSASGANFRATSTNYTGNTRNASLIVQLLDMAPIPS